MNHRLIEIDDYEPLIGAETIARIKEKTKPLQGCHVVHVNSTYQGGGVATLLDSLTLLMISIGIKTGWRAIQGAADFFAITKKMHNGLQSGKINLTEIKKEIYEEVIYSRRFWPYGY